MRQENWAQAVAQAEQIHKSHPENMKKAYYFQTVKSYSLVTSDWRRIEVPPSSLLTFHAWLELTNQNYDETIALTKKCVDIYSNDALIQQSRLDDFLSKKEAHNAWALNNVATCFYIMGQSFFQKGQYQEAYNTFKKIRDNFSFSQCYDPSQGFWKPAKTAQIKMQEMIDSHKVRDTDRQKPITPVKTIQKPRVIKPVVKAPKTDIRKIEDPPPHLQPPLTHEPTEIKEPEIQEDFTVTQEPISQEDIIEQTEDRHVPPSEEAFTKAPMEHLIMEDMESEEMPETISQPEEQFPETERYHELPPDEAIPEPAIEPAPEIEVQAPIPDISVEKETLPEEMPQEDIDKKDHKPREPKVYDFKDKKGLKEVMVFVKKGLTLKWTDQINSKGMYEVIEKRSGQPKIVLEFKGLEEFYTYAEKLGFSK